MDKNQKICLTGPPGSGKTTLLNLAKNKGFQTFNSDDIARQIRSGDKSVVKLIEQVLGLKKEGTKNGKIPLNLIKTEAILIKMEHILHPLIQEKLERWLEEKQNEKHLLVEVPLVFEAGWQNLFDQIWFVDLKDEGSGPTPHPLTTWPEEFRQLILNRHMPSELKKKKCDQVITSLDDFRQLLKR